MKAPLLILFLFLATMLIAQEIPGPPVPPRLVNDYVGILQTDDKDHLESELVQFARQTSTQITVLLVRDFGGTSKEDFAVKVAEKWGIGQKGKNNGIVMVIKPKVGNTRGEAFIATGYGLEGAVPDVVAHRIIDIEMIPSFKEGRYYEGIRKGCSRLMELTKGEYTADEYMNKTDGGGPGAGLLVIIIFIIILSVIFRKGNKDRHHSLGSSNLPLWMLMSMMGGNSRGSHGGNYGHFNGGTGGFGGGGGFGGFGGGSFGGGGAGGSW